MCPVSGQAPYSEKVAEYLELLLPAGNWRLSVCKHKTPGEQPSICAGAQEHAQDMHLAKQLTS